MKTLYSFTDENQKEVFGQMIGKNEQGHLVLEVKGSGAIVVRPASEVTEVLPYTVSIKNTNSNITSHIEVAKGSVVKGDLLVSSAGNIFTVVELDSKNRSAQSSKGFRILETRKLG